MGSPVKLLIAIAATGVLLGAVVGCSSDPAPELNDKAAPPGEGAVAAPVTKKNLPGARGMTGTGAAPPAATPGAQAMTKPGG